MNGIHDFVKALAEKRASDKDDYSNWLNRRFADHWETFEVTSDVADFGIVQWSGRPLDAIMVKTVIQQKTRLLGQYARDCFMFGLVDDVEFAMQRDLFAVNCDNTDGFIKTKDLDRWEKV